MPGGQTWALSVNVEYLKETSRDSRPVYTAGNPSSRRGNDSDISDP